MKSLHVLMGGIPMGRMTQGPGGKLSLEYLDSWTRSPQAFPLSFSLPLTAREHSGRTLENFLWNLLPDNEDTLKAWGRDYGVSHRNAFALLEKVGEDCAGAVQFVTDEWLLQNAGGGEITWIDEQEVEARLKRLNEERTWTGRRPSDRGHFSLPGAQPKMALLFQEGHWGVPSGRIATTHILKPPLPHLNGTTENEHACLQLASRLGLTAAESAVGHFGEQVAIVVTRYDREQDNSGIIRRYHQEDLCQALGIHPEGKYQKDGGPSPEKIAGILAQTTDPADALDRFFRALVFNFLIGGTDAHAKNYSMIHLPGRKSYLAPLYDLISYDPYVDDSAEFGTLKMAMKIKYYEFEKVMPRHWETLSGLFRKNPDQIMAIINEYASAIPDQMASVRDQCFSQGLEHPILNSMVDRLALRCERIVRVYDFGVSRVQSVGALG